MERPKLNTQIYEEACKWFIECRAGDLKDGARRVFDSWLRKSPEHLSAYLEIAAIWDEGPSLGFAGQYDAESLLGEASPGRDNIVPLSDARLSASAALNDLELCSTPLPVSVASAENPISHSRTGGRFRRWRLGAVAASLVVVAIAGWIWLEGRLSPVYATALGEQRSLEFADGSTVALNSRSKIRVHFTDRERDVELLSGQALFHVAKDHTRPFIVKVGSTQVRAVGTEFDVYQKLTDTVVTVVEGRVAVLTKQPIAASGDAPIIAPAGQSGDSTSSAQVVPPLDAGRAGNIFVSAGEQLTVKPDRLQKSSHANVATVTAWTQRQLVFESASLAEVAEEFNRYNARQLVIADPGLDSFHISGVFSSTDPASLIRFLRARPGLRVVETSTEFRIEKNI